MIIRMPDLYDKIIRLLIGNLVQMPYTLYHVRQRALLLTPPLFGGPLYKV